MDEVLVWVMRHPERKVLLLGSVAGTGVVWQYRENSVYTTNSYYAPTDEEADERLKDATRGAAKMGFDIAVQPIVVTVPGPDGWDLDEWVKRVLLPAVPGGVELP